mmetsp:Transcript_88262/g.175392  ORF Transcript_88262/g.175392 Transcript_88262/m.175392 type:complete len:241 (-) Transcript_88262:138-860(-)
MPSACIAAEEAPRLWPPLAGGRVKMDQNHRRMTTTMAVNEMTTSFVSVLSPNTGLANALAHMVALRKCVCASPVKVPRAEEAVRFAAAVALVRLPSTNSAQGGNSNPWLSTPESNTCWSSRLCGPIGGTARIGAMAKSAPNDCLAADSVSALLAVAPLGSSEMRMGICDSECICWKSPELQEATPGAAPKAEAASGNSAEVPSPSMTFLSAPSKLVAGRGSGTAGINGDASATAAAVSEP